MLVWNYGNMCSGAPEMDLSSGHFFVGGERKTGKPDMKKNVRSKCSCKALYGGAFASLCSVYLIPMVTPHL